MKAFQKHWAKLAVVVTVFVALFSVEVVRGQYSPVSPGLRIALTNTNQMSLIITNGTINASYLIYSNEFLNTNFHWVIATNGAASQTNFVLPMGDTETEFYKANYNTNAFPYVLTLTIDSPANGSNVQ
jgi:hypothetical protein